MSYVIAFYEIDKAYGGSEEGGWWFNTGTLVRVFAVRRTEASAFAVARRANALLTRLQGSKRSVGSVLYDGGRHEAHVYENTAPAHFPESRPHYE